MIAELQSEIHVLKADIVGLKDYQSFYIKLKNLLDQMTELTGNGATISIDSLKNFMKSNLY